MTIPPEKQSLSQKIEQLNKAKPRFGNLYPNLLAIRKSRQTPRDIKQREAVIAKVQAPSKYTLLTIPEAALYFEAKPRTIYRWRNGGKLRDGAKRGTITIASVKKLERSSSKARVNPKNL